MSMGFHQPFCSCLSCRFDRAERMERIARYKRQHEAMARAIARQRDTSRIASLETVRMMAREPVVFGGGRLAGKTVGLRLPRCSPPAAFSTYQGEHA